MVGAGCNVPRGAAPGDEAERDREQHAGHQPQQQGLPDQLQRLFGIVEVDTGQQSRAIGHGADHDARFVAALAG